MKVISSVNSFKKYFYTFAAGITCALICLSTGTQLSWTSPVLIKLNNSTGNNEENPFDKPINSVEQAWIGSSMTLGSIFGPFISGFTTDRIGRKYTLIFGAGIPLLAEFLILAFSNVIFLYYVARFIGGLAHGILLTAVPLYLAEISEPTVRGSVSSLLFILSCIGQVLCLCVGPFVSIRIFCLICALVPALFILLFSFFPDTPYYYLIKKDFAAAESSLTKLRSHAKEGIKGEMEEIKKDVENKLNSKSNLKEVLKNRGLRRALMICLVLASIQQLTGITAIVFYATTIFEAAGSKLDSNISSIILGCIKFMSSFSNALLVDKFGRKMLLLISAIGMFLSEAVIGLYFYLKDKNFDVTEVGWIPLLFLMVFIVMYNLGFGPIPWIYMGEVFPSNMKGACSSSVVFLNGVVGFIISYVFPLSSEYLGIGITFWWMSAFCFSAIFFVLIFVKETKQKSFKEIEDMFN